MSRNDIGLLGLVVGSGFAASSINVVVNYYLGYLPHDRVWVIPILIFIAVMGFATASAALRHPGDSNGPT